MDRLRICPVLRARLTEGIQEITDMATKQKHQKKVLPLVIINRVLFSSMCFLHISISPCAWHRASCKEDVHTVFVALKHIRKAA